MQRNGHNWKMLKQKVTKLYSLEDFMIRFPYTTSTITNGDDFMETYKDAKLTFDEWNDLCRTFEEAFLK